MRRFKHILVASVLCSMFIIVGCSNNSLPSDTSDDGLVINSISYSLGGDLDKTLVSYNFNIWNKTKNSIIVKTVEPILSDSLRKRLVDNKIKNEVNNTIHGNTSKGITGSFHLNTQGLDKQGINNLNIDIKKFRIITEQEIGIE
ncbi:hypothetical protein PMSD_06445 [Paenibacillus macquariensis subsp. defensor]|nr:hypothetical protein PMSD_06445 [Paenibacillus macquariensis subsp. defensor]